MRKLLSPLVIVLILVVARCQAATIEGKVVAIADGDTLTVLDDSKQQIKIRLNGIDTPEKKQAYGDKAKQAGARRMVQKRPIRPHARRRVH